jgi:molybdopterin-binding protein
MLTVSNLSLRLGSFELKNINFTVEKGAYFVLLGLSGVGKTVLLETIAGLHQPLSGTITLRGKDIAETPVPERNISIVYQDADLFPHLSVYENIAYPLRSRKKKSIDDVVHMASQQTGIEMHLHRKPDTLSGGEYQRAALARSLASESDIFLLDEPLSSIDAPSKSGLRALLRQLHRSGITILHVTHDYEEALSLATMIGIMEDGGLTHCAPPAEIFQHPKSKFVAHFTGIKNYFRGELRSRSGSDLKEFSTGRIIFSTLTDERDGEAFLTIGPEEITLSNEHEHSSNRNHFQGTITDIAPGRLGLEVTINIGEEIIASISTEARQALRLDIGKSVWISFKASACKLYS